MTFWNGLRPYGCLIGKGINLTCVLLRSCVVSFILINTHALLVQLNLSVSEICNNNNTPIPKFFWNPLLVFYISYVTTVTNAQAFRIMFWACAVGGELKQCEVLAVMLMCLTCTILEYDMSWSMYSKSQHHFRECFTIKTKCYWMCGYILEVSFIIGRECYMC
jgi:hypothetical protein